VQIFSLYRAVASYVTTVNQLYISLLILGYLRYLPRLCGKRVVGCTVNSETGAAWNLSFYYVNYRYNAVIVLCKSSEYCTVIVDTDFPSAAIEHNTFLPYGSALSRVFVT